jgi:putative endonuclease
MDNNSQMWYVYIVECSDGTLYTGYTNDVDARVAKHNAGKGAKYTRSRRPVIVCYTEKLETKSLAMKRECYIKKLTRAQKLALIEDEDGN